MTVLVSFAEVAPGRAVILIRLTHQDMAEILFTMSSNLEKERRYTDVHTKSYVATTFYHTRVIRNSYIKFSFFSKCIMTISS